MSGPVLGADNVEAIRKFGPARWLAFSRRRPGTTYTVDQLAANLWQCDCQAGARGIRCWHVVAARRSAAAAVWWGAGLSDAQIARMGKSPFSATVVLGDDCPICATPLIEVERAGGLMDECAHADCRFRRAKEGE